MSTTEAGRWLEVWSRVCAKGSPGLLHAHATHNVEVDSSLGAHYGREEWMSALAEGVAGFNGFKITHSVAWSMDMGAMGTAVSSELSLEAVNDGDSRYGPATQKTAHFEGASLALVINDRAYRAWIVVDHATVARELGADLPGLARAMAANEPRRGGVPSEFGEVRANLGQLAPPSAYAPIPGLPPGLAAWGDKLNALWNERRLDDLGTLYHDGAESGHDDHPWRKLLTAFPDAVLFIERACVSDAGRSPQRVALLWRWIGRHTGLGLGVGPSGFRMHVRGLSHFDLEDGRIVRERIFHDTLGLLKDVERRRREP